MERSLSKRSLLAQRRSDQNSPGPFLLVCESHALAPVGHDPSEVM
jgi:hypothetical protein